MPSAISGTLITTDVATHVYILNLEDSQQFLIQDLDETHLLIKPEYVAHIKDCLEYRAKENTASNDED